MVILMAAAVSYQIWAFEKVTILSPNMLISCTHHEELQKRRFHTHNEVHTVRFKETLTDNHDHKLSHLHTHITHITIHTHTLQNTSVDGCVCSSHVTNRPLKPERSTTIPLPNNRRSFSHMSG